MWFFNSKDSESTTSSLGLNFGSDPVPGYSVVKSQSEENNEAIIYGPYNIRWKINEGLNRKTKEDVSLLHCSLNTNASTSEVNTITSSLIRTVKWMKTLRHPNVLNWIAGTELGSSKLPSEFYVVTERVLPLREYLRRKGDCGNFNLISSWGIHQIAKSLVFLNDDGKLSHNAVRLDAVFVTTAGEWKLGNLDFVESTKESPPVQRSSVYFSHTNASDPYLPPDKCLFDSWGLGCLIWEIFNPHCELQSTNQLSDMEYMNRLPSTLLPDYRRLIGCSQLGRRSGGTNINKSVKRSSVAQFLKSALNRDRFLNNDYVNTLLFLEEIQLKDAQERSSFLADLTKQINTFPDDVCRHKILPHLVHGLQFGSAGVDALLPVLRLISLLTEADFQATVLPCLLKLFNSNERATRVRLLEQLPNFIDHLPDKIVQSQIFAPVANGFTDSNPVVREATIRAMIHLAPKLSDKLLNDTLLRYLSTLQSRDDQGGIRTNATVCLAKLVSYFTSQTQQGALLSAFLRATRDTFVPNRQAAVTAIAATQEYYTDELLAGKLLPCLSFLTVDPEASIRTDAFRAIRAILDRLEQASKNREHTDRQVDSDKSGQDTIGQTTTTMQSKITASSTATALSQWAISALSFSSRLLQSTNSTGTGIGRLNNNDDDDDDKRKLSYNTEIINKQSMTDSTKENVRSSVKQSRNNDYSFNDKDDDDVDDDDDDDGWNMENNADDDDDDDVDAEDNDAWNSTDPQNTPFSSSKQFGHWSNSDRSKTTTTTTTAKSTHLQSTSFGSTNTTINPMKLSNSSMYDQWDADAFFDNLQLEDDKRRNKRSTNTSTVIHKTENFALTNRKTSSSSSSTSVAPAVSSSTASATPKTSMTKSASQKQRSQQSTNRTTPKTSNSSTDKDPKADDGNGVDDWGNW